MCVVSKINVAYSSVVALPSLVLSVVVAVYF